MDLDRIEALKTYAGQRQTIQDGINQMTMTALQFELLKLDEERLKKEEHVAEMKELSAQQKAEDLASVAAYYAQRRALAEADASAEVALVKATQEAIIGTLNAGIDNFLGAFQAFGEGTLGVLGAVGSAFKSTVNACISALKQLVIQELATAVMTIALKKKEAIARVIASVMELPFPLNLLAVGGAIAAVSALFSAIKLGEGGVVMGPTLALVGDVPEAVIPLHKLGMFMAGEGRGEGASFELNINSPLIQTTGLTRGQVDELAPYLFNAVESEAGRYGFSLKKR
jgi:ribosomal protein L14E/L6E/L27E